MKCPKCPGNLEKKLMKNYVFIDICNQCEGKWLDMGELNFFVRNSKELEIYSQKGLKYSKNTELNCPQCKDVYLNQGQIHGFDFNVEECPSCHGLFFDKKELESVSDSNKFNNFKIDSKVNKPKNKTKTHSPIKLKTLPSLGATSILILSALYAILVGFVIFFIELNILSYGIGIIIIVATVFIQFVFSPIVMDWSLKLFGSLNWYEFSQLPPKLKTFIPLLCQKNDIPFPKIGIIDDGSPQAYTYGRTPASARLVLSRGLIEILNDDEIESVIAHEMGHIKHWDFVVMTLAQLVPIILYHIYRTCMRISTGSKNRSNKNNSSQSALLLAAVVAYFFYQLSRFIVLFISRLREYWADRFSVEMTKNPNAMILALTKIGYGLVTTEKNSEQTQEGLDKQKAIQAMGIVNIDNSKEIALALQGKSGFSHNPETIKEVMRWDLWSPWATYYELQSTHPLIAKRIQAISNHAQFMNIKPNIIFDEEKPESYWDDFFVDIIYLFMPIIFAFLFSTVYFWYTMKQIPFTYFGMALSFTIGYSMGGLLKLFEIYPSKSFVDVKISSLLKNIKVSPVRSFPIKVRGEVIGRGDAGNIFSEDIVLRDQTGIIFLDYQQPLAFFNLFFALFKLKRFKGQQVTIEGWYRRSPIPYIEIKTIKSQFDFSRAYTYNFKLASLIFLPLLVLLTKFLWSQYIEKM